MENEKPADKNAERNWDVGAHAQIDPDVILGYTYPGWSKKLRVGSHAIIHSGSVLYAGSTIGDFFTCGHHVLIRAEVEIGDRCVVLHKCTLEGKIRLGYGVKLMAHIYVPSRTVIGDMVFVGPGTTFLNHKYPMRSTAPVVGATIGDRVGIGGGCTICPGVTIGENSFIGAGSLVNKDVPPNTLAYGVPARHFPLPAELAGGNWAELNLSGTDLWGGQTDKNWQSDPHWSTREIPPPGGGSKK